MTANPFWPAGPARPALPEVAPGWSEESIAASPGPGRLLRRPLAIGVVVIGVFISFFLGWGAVAPLAGGSIAPALVTPDGGIRTVQHLEGGIIRQLHVREGDRVEQGDPLVSLANEAAEAEMRILRQRRTALLVEQARLEAETAGRAELFLPVGLAADEAVLDAEHRVFHTRRAMVEARKDILSRRIDQLRERIEGYRAQAASVSEQLAFLGEEIGDKTRLMSGGLAVKGDLLQLRRMSSSLDGDLGEYQAEIASAEQQIDEARLELLAIDVEHAAQNAVRTAEVRREMDEVDRMLEANGDVIERSVVIAPVAGVVANLRIVTTGGVVSPGEPILDIVPRNEQLVVDAMVQPKDIDLIHEGTKAKVTLTAYAANSVPPLVGEVVSISATTMQDQATNRDYYLTRVAVPRSALEDADFTLVPGMSAEVLFVSAERTFLAYLLEPLTKMVRRGLREG